MLTEIYIEALLVDKGLAGGGIKATDLNFDLAQCD
jgi:hypothetical protein